MSAALVRVPRACAARARGSLGVRRHVLTGRTVRLSDAQRLAVADITAVGVVWTGTARPLLLSAVQ